MFKNLLFVFTLFVSMNCVSQENFKIGDTAPEFKLWFTDGEKLTKNDILNKVVVFKFWFTSCLPCLLDISQINKLADDLNDRDDILFIAPALDRKDIVKDFITKNNFKFKAAYSAMDVSQIFNKKQVYPSYFIINKKGEFSYVDNGSRQSHFEDLEAAVYDALKE